MGTDEPTLLQLWREKRGEAEPEGLAAEHLCLFPVFMRFLETHAWPSAVFVNELDPSASQHRLDCSERSCIACIPTDLNIGDRVPMEASRFREVSHGPIQRCPSHSYSGARAMGIISS